MLVRVLPLVTTINIVASRYNRFWYNELLHVLKKALQIRFNQSVQLDLQYDEYLDIKKYFI